MNKKTLLLDGIQQLPEESKALGLLWAFAMGLKCFPQDGVDSEEAACRRAILGMLQELDKEALERICCLTEYLYLKLDEEEPK